MAELNRLAKLGYLMSAVALAVTASLVHLERRLTYDRDFVAGEEHVMAETIGVLLRSKAQPNLYLKLDRASRKTALNGAKAVLRGPAVLSDVTLEADTGRVRWSDGHNRPSAPGLLVRIAGRARVPADAGNVRDTLDLELPGLSAVADSTNHVPMIAPRNYLKPIESVRADMRYYDIRARDAAAHRARHLLVFETALAAVLAMIAVRVAYRMMQ